MYGTKWVLMFLNSKVLLLFPLNGKVLTHLAFFGNSTFNRTVRLIESTEYFANQPPWNSTTVPRLLQMSHPNGKLSRMSPTAIFSCILLWKNMRKKPPDKYYPPLRYYLALVIVCTVLMYCKQIKAVGNTKGERGTIRPPPQVLVETYKNIFFQKTLDSNRWHYDKFAGMNENWTDIRIILRGSSHNPNNQNDCSSLFLSRAWLRKVFKWHFINWNECAF